MIAYILFAVSMIVACRGWRRGVRSMGASYRFFLAVFCVGTLAAALTSQTTSRLMQAAPSPWPQVVFLLGAWSSLGAAFSVLSMLSYALIDPETARRRTRRNSVFLITCLAVMGILLALIHPPPEAMVDFIGVYGRDPRATMFYAVDSLYVLGAVVGFCAVIVRYLRTAHPARQIVISLSWEIAGAAFAFLWCVWSFVRTVAGARHADLAIHGPIVADILASSSVGVMIVGAVWLVGFRKAADLWSSWSTWRLQPLWTQLCTVNPKLALNTAEWPPEQVLQRHILEIADWFSRLPMYVHPDLPAWTADLAQQHRLRPEDTEAVLAAAVITSGVPALTAGRRYGVPSHAIILMTAQAGTSTGAKVRALRRITALAGLGPAYLRLTGHRQRRLVRQLSHRALTEAPATSGIAAAEPTSTSPLAATGRSPHVPD